MQQKITNVMRMAKLIAAVSRRRFGYRCAYTTVQKFQAVFSTLPKYIESVNRTINSLN